MKDEDRIRAVKIGRTAARLTAIRSLMMFMLVTLIVLGASCNSETEAKAIVLAAIDKTMEVQSCRIDTIVVMTYEDTEETETYVDEVEIQEPGAFRWSASQPPSWLEFIQIPDEAYYRTEENPEWRVYEESGSFVIYPPSLSASLEPLKSMSDPEVLPNDVVDGMNCSHYRGDIEWRLGDWATIELWIDRDDYIRQLTRTLRWVPEPGGGTERWVKALTTTHFYDFNDDIIIVPPEV
jgi:hypothetical protein